MKADIDVDVDVDVDIDIDVDIDMLRAPLVVWEGAPGGAGEGADRGGRYDMDDSSGSSGQGAGALTGEPLAHVPGTCTENPAGGAGGAGTIPPGDVGASAAAGDYATDPPKEPLGTGNGDCSDPCMECPSAPAGLRVFCRKPDWGALCSERCFAKSIPCVPLALHPFKPNG